MTLNLVCSECGGTMKMGFIPDQTYGRIENLFWVEGRPVKSFWTGLKIDDKKWHYVVAYRCEHCGFLKLYAGSDQS